MLADEIKQRTALKHASLEKDFIAQLKQVETEHDYGNLLSVLFGFYHAIEKQIGEKINESLIPDFADRRKAALLLKDLRAMGFDEYPPLCDNVHYIQSHAEALGALYVVEGSTLGGQVIAKMLTVRLSERFSPSCEFFCSYGDNTMLMWDRFKMYLNAGLDKAQEEQVVLSASATFITFKNWLNLHADS